MWCETKGKACNDWKQQELKHYLQQLVHDNENIDVLMNIGILYAKLDESGPAFHYLWQAYDLHKDINPQGPGHLDITMALADLHLDRQEYFEAKRKYWESMQIDWGCQRAHEGFSTAKRLLEIHPPVKRFADKPEPVSIEVINMVSVSCAPSTEPQALAAPVLKLTAA
ncbi:MAG: hypothetical protein DI586_00505 [Micavibrio aeruginosavorus]|uniref:Tetratricopeptide repeat protein n=1 Tax=Micavibrio aeruginosavorus TaxID=349221 RepID=A0A2W5FN72_9BACT|nr:MAG: hypothetical protein DI586_00505 [Micavibrio aeruginosavorus]